MFLFTYMAAFVTDTKCYILSVTMNTDSIWAISVNLKVNPSRFISYHFGCHNSICVCCNELLVHACNLFSQHLYEKSIPAGHKLSRSCMEPYVMTGLERVILLRDNKNRSSSLSHGSAFISLRFRQYEMEWEMPVVSTKILGVYCLCNKTRETLS